MKSLTKLGTVEIPGSVKSVCFYNTYIAFGCSDLFLYDIYQLQITHFTNKSDINSLTANSDYIFTGDEKGNLSKWDLKGLAHTVESKSRINKVVINKQHLGTCHGNGDVKIWNKDTMEVIFSKNVINSSLRTMGFISDQTVFTSGLNHKVLIVDITHNNNKNEEGLKYHTSTVWGSCNLANGYYATAGADYLIGIWELNQDEKKLVEKISLDTGGWIRDIIEIDNNILAYSRDDSSEIFDLNQKKIIQKLPEKGLAINYSDKFEYLVIDKTIYYYPSRYKLLTHLIKVYHKYNDCFFSFK